MFTKEQLAKWRSEGFEFDSLYDEVAVEKKEEIEEQVSIKGYWSSDPQGKKILGTAFLEQKVYYHIRTTNIPDSSKITLQLLENDTVLLKPDNKFGGKEIIKHVIIQDNKASLSIILDKTWESLIVEDFGVSIELYWQAYNRDLFPLGKKLESILNVYHSVRFLYFKPAVDSFNLPDILTSSGCTIIFAFGDALEVKDKIAESMDDCRYFIGSRILKKGKLVTNINEIYQRKRNIYNYDIYTNDGKNLVSLERASNFGFKNIYVNNGKPVTTKGLSQLDYFANKGVINGVLKIGKEILGIWDVKEVADQMFADNYGNIPVPTPWAFASSLLTAFVIKPMVEDTIDQIKNELILGFEIQKQKGLEACKKFIKRNDAREIGWYDSLNIDTDTLKKLIKGDFLNLREVRNNLNGDLEHTIFFRELKDEVRGDDRYAVIDCIFISDKLINL